jgi:cell division septation protein DedD
MANERIPDDPYLASDDQFNRASRLDRDLQADPELAEGPASTGRVALFALAIALVLGAVFYGLNNSSINQASTSPPARTAQTQPANPPAPKANTEPGTTTGAATNRPTPPQSSPQGQEIDRSANPPADQNNNNK